MFCSESKVHCCVSTSGTFPSCMGARCLEESRGKKKAPRGRWLGKVVRMSLENNLFEIYWCCFVDFCLSVRYWGSCHLIETPYLLHCTALFRSCCQCSSRQCVRFVIDWLSLNCFRRNDASLQWVRARERDSGPRGAKGWGSNEKKRGQYGRYHFLPLLCCRTALSNLDL